MTDMEYLASASHVLKKGQQEGRLFKEATHDRKGHHIPSENTLPALLSVL